MSCLLFKIKRWLKPVDVSNLNVDNVICLDKMFGGSSNELKSKIKGQNEI